MIINGSIPGDPQEVAKAMARMECIAMEQTTETESDGNGNEEKKTPKRGRKSAKKSEQQEELFHEQAE